jgi:hypothetical protein
MNEEEKLEYFLENGRMMGSRKWGGATAESDYDFIIDRAREKKFFDLLYTLGITTHISYYPNSALHNYRAVKFDFKGRIINVLFYHNEDWDTAVGAINEVARISKIMDLSDKYIRHLICEAVFARAFKP